MGLFMLSEFFKRAGWTVCTGVPPSEADFKRLCHSDWFDAVGVSVSTDRHLEAIASILSRLPESAPNHGCTPSLASPWHLWRLS